MKCNCILNPRSFLLELVRRLVTSLGTPRDQEKLEKKPGEAAVLHRRPGVPEGTPKIKGPAAH